MEVSEFFRTRVKATHDSGSHEYVTDITQHFECPNPQVFGEIALDDGTVLRYLGHHTKPIIMAKKDAEPPVPVKNQDIASMLASEFSAHNKGVAMKIKTFYEREDHLRHTVTHTYQVYSIVAIGPQFEKHHQKYLGEPCQMTRM
jgi:hypothetical protein